MKHSFFFAYGVRSAIVLVWALLMMGILYTGRPEVEAAAVSSSAQGKVLRILSWGDIFDKAYLRQFEEKTGITLEMSSYGSNEELLAKLKMSKGRGYDLIVPSDYAVALLKKEELLKPFDKSKLSFFSRINPSLLGQSYDPDNTHSIPYEWEVFGIAYDKEFFEKRPLAQSWKLLFENPCGAYRIVISNDVLEVIRAAAHYLYGSVDELTDTQVEQVEALLKKQHAWVEAYSSYNLDYYLISGYAPLAFSSSAYVGRRKDFAHKLGFFVPQEGGLVTIENFAMPIHGENEDNVYAFLDFIFTPESMAHHHEIYTYFPATIDILKEGKLDPEIRKLMSMPESDFRKLIFIKQIMPEERMNDLWVAVKS